MPKEHSSWLRFQAFPEIQRQNNLFLALHLLLSPDLCRGTKCCRAPASVPASVGVSQQLSCQHRAIHLSPASAMEHWSLVLAGHGAAGHQGMPPSKATSPPAIYSPKAALGNTWAKQMQPSPPLEHIQNQLVAVGVPGAPFLLQCTEQSSR